MCWGEYIYWCLGDVVSFRRVTVIQVLLFFKNLVQLQPSYRLHHYLLRRQATRRISFQVKAQRIHYPPHLSRTSFFSSFSFLPRLISPRQAVYLSVSRSEPGKSAQLTDGVAYLNTPRRSRRPLLVRHELCSCSPTSAVALPTGGRSCIAGRSTHTPFCDVGRLVRSGAWFFLVFKLSRPSLSLSSFIFSFC